MVTVFNPQALGDPGPTAAAGLIGAGLSSAAGLIGNRTRSKAEILASLLGQAGAGLRESFTRANENEQGREALDFAIQSGQLPGLQGTKVPENLKIDPSSVNALLGQASLPRLLGMQKNIVDIGRITSQSGDPRGGILLERGGTGALDLTGGQEQPQQINQPQPTTTEQAPRQLENGSFALGANETDAIASSSPNLFLRKSEAEAQKSEDEARIKRIEASRTGKRFEQQSLYDQGPDIEPNLMSYSGKQSQPFRIGQRVIPNSQEATDARRNYQEIKNELSPAAAAERLTNFEQKKQRTTKLIGLLEQGEKLIGTNAVNQVLNRMKTDPNYLLVTNDPQAALFKQILDEVAGITALQVTVDVQGTRPTDIDVQKILTTLPNMLGSKAQYIQGMKSLIGDVGATLLDDAVILDRPGVVMTLGPRIEKLTGTQYQFGTNMGIGTTNQRISPRISPQRIAPQMQSESIVPQKTPPRQAVPSTKSSGSNDDLLNFLMQ